MLCYVMLCVFERAINIVLAFNAYLTICIAFAKHFGLLNLDDNLTNVDKEHWFK